MQRRAVNPSRSYYGTPPALLQIDFINAEIPSSGVSTGSSTFGESPRGTFSLPSPPLHYAHS